MKNLFYILVLVLSLNASSNKSYGAATVQEVTSIYDGDTFRANIKDYPKIIGYRVSIRINGIDTPELRGKCKEEIKMARAAKRKTVTLLRGARHIELRNMKRGKYFRILADVYVDGVSVADELLKSGFALKYSGGHKIDWCKKYH
jgi:endonuclease YncB( thermonuclease family)